MLYPDVGTNQHSLSEPHVQTVADWYIFYFSNIIDPMSLLRLSKQAAVEG